MATGTYEPPPFVGSNFKQPRESVDRKVARPKTKAKLARDIAKHERQEERAKLSKSEQRKAAKAWSELSAKVCARDKGICRISGAQTTKYGKGKPNLWGQAHHIVFRSAGGRDFERAGFDVRWQVEREPFCHKVLTRRFGASIFDDVRTVGAANLHPVDVMVGGFPCQDVSVAGRGAGLEGDRSGLFFEFVRLIDELRPSWVVIENVLGLLSNRQGRDFATVLVHLADLGFGVCWRVVDSRYFRVAQRRRRVFLVLGARVRCAESILLEPASGAWGVETSREAGPDVAATLRSRSASRGVNAPGRGGEDDENIVAYCLRADPGGIGQGHNVTFIADPITANEARTYDHGGNNAGRTHNLIAGTVTANYGDASPRGDDADTLVAHTLTASMHKRHDEDTDTLIANTLLAPSGGSRVDDLNQTFLPQQLGVRRLTPLECERVQGFPDGWTCLCGEGHRGSRFCKCPDTPRYKALGNAVTVTVAEWIARRVLAEQSAKVGAA